MELVKANSHLAINRSFGTEEFGQLLEKAMTREPKLDQTKHSFAPSNLGYHGACPRYWYYARNGADFTYDTAATAVANMDSGSDAGRRLANLLDKAGILVSAEAEAKYDDPPIFGYIDAIVNWKGEEVVVEIKTSKNSTWTKRALENQVPDYQLGQLLIYMYVTGHDKGFLLTENKDTHQLFIYPVKMTDANKAKVESIFDWMRKVKENADDGELPTRPFNKSSFACKGCPVRDTCWDGWTRGKVNGEDPNPGIISLPVLEIT